MPSLSEPVPAFRLRPVLRIVMNGLDDTFSILPTRSVLMISIPAGFIPFRPKKFVGPGGDATFTLTAMYRRLIPFMTTCFL